MFDGRIKTLPPFEGGLLYRRSIQKDIDEAIKYNIKPIDMVVCNLYQFQKAIEKPGITLAEALEMIDIGGPTMIRSAAKNFPDVIVVPSPEYYNIIINELRTNKGAITEKTRLFLAQKKHFRLWQNTMELLQITSKNITIPMQYCLILS